MRRLLIAAMLLFLPNPLFSAFKCPYPTKGDLPPLVSGEQQTLEKRQKELEEKLAQIDGRVGAFRKELQQLRRDKKAPTRGKWIETKASLLLEEKPKLQKLLQGIVASQKSIKEKIESVKVSREVALCEMMELQKHLEELVPRFASLQCKAEVASIEGIITDLSLERERLIREQEVGLVQMSLLSFKEDGAGLFKRLYSEEIKLGYPERLEKLHKELRGEDEKGFAKGERKIQKLVSNQVDLIGKIKGQDRCGRVGGLAVDFKKQYAIELQNSPKPFWPKAKKFSPSQVALRDLWHYLDFLLGADFAPVGIPVNVVALANLKGIVLYVHWQEDPYEAAISDRVTINEKLRGAERLFREYSYDQFRPHFDVCEVGATQKRPSLEQQHLIFPTMVDLCDPYVDFNQYEWIIFYPVAQHGGRTAYAHGSEWIETDEGRLSKKVISYDPGPFSSHVVAHEGGHILGLRHAHDLECDEHVFWTDERCTGQSEYGDVFDEMGSGDDHYNCSYKTNIGWSDTISQSPGTESYDIGAIDGNAGSYPRCLLVGVSDSLTDGLEVEYLGGTGGSHREGIDEPCDNLSIEYRKFTSEVGGLLLRCKTEEGRRRTYLLDCTPNSQGSWRDDYRDGFILPSQTCHTGLGWDVRFEPLEGDLARVFVVPAVEICDDLDNDSDGSVDEGCDDDGDGYCDYAMDRMAHPAVCSHDEPDGFDNDPSRYTVPEICDNADNDFDREIDEGCDDDGDGYCDASMNIVGIPDVCPSGGGDCDDDDDDFDESSFSYSSHPGPDEPRYGNVTCNCVDSDGGFSTYVEGVVTVTNRDGTVQRYPDLCDGWLHEQVCIYPAGPFSGAARDRRLHNISCDCGRAGAARCF